MMEDTIKKLVGSEDERAVSPVIGVILMVAITVILAAVIAAFVLDIGPGETDPSATFDADVNSDGTVDVTLNSLDGNTDGIVVVDGTDDEDDFEGDTLTVSGESKNYPDEGGDLAGEEDAALIAFTADDPSDASGFDDIDNFAIIDNLDELEDLEE